MKNKPIHMIYPNTLGGENCTRLYVQKVHSAVVSNFKKMWKQEDCT